MIDTNFPSHASVVVIGGGIMGCSTLYHLGKMGVSDAILLERNKLTGSTTWHSAAKFGLYGVHRIDQNDPIFSATLFPT